MSKKYDYYICFYDKCPFKSYTGANTWVCPFKGCIYKTERPLYRNVKELNR